MRPLRELLEFSEKVSGTDCIPVYLVKVGGSKHLGTAACADGGPHEGVVEWLDKKGFERLCRQCKEAEDVILRGEYSSGIVNCRALMESYQHLQDELKVISEEKHQDKLDAFLAAQEVKPDLVDGFETEIPYKRITVNIPGRGEVHFSNYGSDSSVFIRIGWSSQIGDLLYDTIEKIAENAKNLPDRRLQEHLAKELLNLEKWNELALTSQAREEIRNVRKEYVQNLLKSNVRYLVDNRGSVRGDYNMLVKLYSQGEYLENVPLIVAEHLGGNGDDFCPADFSKPKIIETATVLHAQGGHYRKLENAYKAAEQLEE